jgi:hypothetical protein
MILIALIAVALKLATWWNADDFRPPERWETYWLKKPAHDG